MRPTALALAAIVATVLLSACAAGTASPAAPSPANVASPSGPPASSPSAGSASRPPATPASPGTAAPASTGPSATPSPTTETTMPPFTLTSTDIAAGDLIPRRFTCDGADVSPELDWSGVPEGAAALVLVVDDPDARGFVHWTVLDLTASATGGLPRGVSTSPDAPAQGTNDFGRPGWGGPCPPSGTHRYVFTLYAVGEPLGLAGAPRADRVRKALAGANVLGKAGLEARYRRGG